MRGFRRRSTSMNRYRDWLDQARVNLDHADKAAAIGHNAWGCFAAQQAAEAAVKALHLKRGQVAWGHSVLDLLLALPDVSEADETLLDKARILDKYYIPTRYPDAHPAGTAARHYTAAEALEAIEHATFIVEYCERKSLET